MSSNGPKTITSLAPLALAISNTDLFPAAQNVAGNAITTAVTFATVANAILKTVNSSASSNGYAPLLGNNIVTNWGIVTANSSSGTIVFPFQYTTNAFNITATSIATSDASYAPAILSWNKVGAYIRTANAVSSNICWQAIGQ